MRWSDVTARPPDRLLRQFAGLCILFFGGLAAWQGLRGSTTAAWVLGLLAAAIGPLGILRPQAIRWFYAAWMAAAFPIGWTISTCVLVLLFFLVFTPIAVCFRLLGRDALRLRSRAEADTYWIDKPLVTDPRSYLSQS